MTEKNRADSKRDRWNQKFSDRPEVLSAGEPFVLEHVVQGFGPRVLDLACGDGRNAIALAKTGFDVTGVDFSEVGLARLEKFASQRELLVKTRCLNLEVERSLSEFTDFDTVVMSRYLPSPILLSQLASVLREGGKLVICTFNELQHSEKGFTARFCLKPGHLDLLKPSFHFDIYERYEQAEQHLDGYVLTRAKHRPSVV